MLRLGGRKEGFSWPPVDRRGLLEGGGDGEVLGVA